VVGHRLHAGRLHLQLPDRVEDAAEHYAEFQKLGAEVYIVTTDTHFSHKVWHETSPAVGKAKFPLVGDPTHTLTRAFDVHIEEEGLALRGTFVINPEGVIKTLEIHDNAIARDMKERCASSRPRSTSPRTRARSARPSGRRAPRPSRPSLDLVGKI
jgi:peroxiredoxin